jgi:hypothetical protein
LKSIGRAFERLLGGNVPETALLLLTLAGAGALLRPRPGGVSRAALATAALALLTFAIAYAWSNVSSPAWALRYLCIVLAPVAVVIGAGLAELGPVAGLVLAIVFVGSWYGEPTHASLGHKSNVAAVAQRLAPSLPPGTRVFSTQPEQVPALRFYLPPGLRYVTPLGPVPDPQVMDWRDAMTRLDRPSAETMFTRTLDQLRPGQRLLLVQPRFSSPSAPWTRRIRQLSRRAHRDRLRRHDIRLVRTVVPRRGYDRSTVAALLLERRRGAGP